MIEIVSMLRKYLGERRANILIRLIVSFIILIFLYFKFDQDSLGLINKSILIYYLFSLPITVVCLFIMSVRWKKIIENTLKIKINVIDLFKFYYISNFFSLFLPGSIGGDVTRIYNSKKKYNINLKYATASVLMERVMGLAGVVLIFFFGSQMVPLPLPLFKFNIINYAILFFILILLFFKSKIIRDTNLIIGYKLMLSLVFLTVVAQFGDIFIVKLLSVYFNLDITVSHLMVIMPIVYIISSLPVSLGGLGIREYTMAALFPLFGFDPSISVLISLILYCTKIFTGLVGMILYTKDYR